MTVFRVKILTTAGATFLTKGAKESLISACEFGTCFWEKAGKLKNSIRISNGECILSLILLLYPQIQKKAAAQWSETAYSCIAPKESQRYADTFSCSPSSASASTRALSAAPFASMSRSTNSIIAIGAASP